MPNIKPNIFNGQAVTAEVFLADYWQQRPYLFRQTDLPLATVPNREQMFQLAARDGVQSRIIYSPDHRRFQAVYDEPNQWADLIDMNPTLLVSDIEKWCPQTLAVLTAFSFIKAWRFDDLMLSYAPKGASVGAHIDQYDVFLVQVKGQRQWSYDDTILADFEPVDDSDLAVIADYEPHHTHILSPGDVLYLPPRIAHHGISLDDDCLTLSVGLRSPSSAELITAVADHMAQQLPDSERLTDAGHELNATGAISGHEIAYLRKQIQRMNHLTDGELADILGQFISAYRLLDDTPGFNDHNHGHTHVRNPADNFTYYAISDQQAQLYINGDKYPCTLAFAQQLCNQSYLDLQQLQSIAADQELFNQLLENQHIIALD
ncbi:MAG: cupin domain-containing protein [Proteobacteria bacterium]|nr:MAG: cupin domain-containing protein [Pseudomonadota bacterium]